MSLRTTILLSLLTVVLLYGGAVYAVQKLILQPSFEELEHQQASRDMARAAEAIRKDADSLDAFCHDWAAWDDTFRFVTDGNAEYIHTNLEQSTFENGNFDLVYVCDLQGRVVWGQARDPDADWSEVVLSNFPRTPWPLDHPLLALHDPEATVHGLMQTDRAPLLVASRPIVDSLKLEPMRGWLIMGRFLTASHVAELVEQTRVPFAVWAAREQGLAPPERHALAVLTLGQDQVQVPAGENQLHVYSVLPDISGKPSLLLRADLPREVMSHGERALLFARTSMLAAALLLLGVLYVLLQRTVVRPLAALTVHAVAVGASDDLSVRIGSPRRDEFGVLAREFDRMVERLQASRVQLVESARLGGRSEVATAVLHNVGNVLNSVNVSAEMVGRRLRTGGRADADRLARTLCEHEADLENFLLHDERGRHLPAFLVALGRTLVEESALIEQELTTLMSGVEHIRALVDSQQSHAGGSGVLERVALARQVEGALHLAEAGTGGVPIEITREFDEVPEVLVNRHKLIEILVNLIRNARQSLQGAPVATRRLCLRVLRAGAAHVRIEVVDNGLGIEAANLQRIFSQGFSTRQGGHGFGLHAAANAATELGGTLRARSDGPGTGATFVLELPISHPQPAPSLHG